MGSIYGKLYNKFAVKDPRGLAPEGWHLPSDEEWKELEICLGMSTSQADDYYLRGIDQGGKLKSAGTVEDGDGIWNSPNTGATNESGFSAFPGGYRMSNGTYYGNGCEGGWWSLSNIIKDVSFYRYLTCNTEKIGRLYEYNGSGYSIRCVKDK
jgi:uncharacterized protein (TIGR02145 family)